ncbi:segregation and condensation protein A [Clavibacter tessellarius]|uniref:segregation and condensation protein A n=1 Tax=Clavibacter tessellarius TaxID=31965 RepID=UPI003251080A
MDITEVSLSLVTNEFIAHIRGLDGPDDLDEASSFLVVAATLLDLKLVGLLPQGELVDAEDVALLEARDLLFARLLQYRAFKEAASWFQQRLATESTRAFRDVPLEERFRAQVPEARLDDLARRPRGHRAARARAAEVPTVGLDHLHAPLVSIREQAAVVVARLRVGVPVTFREARGGCRAHGRRDRALPRGARAVPRRRHRVRPARGARRADAALDRRELERRRAREPGGGL